jgi:uncharacterized protein (TIGR03032 family)
MSPITDTSATLQVAGPETAYREIPYEFSRSLVAILDHVGASLLVTTYQAGKLAVVGVRMQKLALAFRSFEQAMGVAVSPDRIAVGTRTQTWVLRAAPDIAARIEPAGGFDGCFLARTAHVTGEIHGHEMAWVGDELWIVNTLFSCLCTLDGRHSFVPRWWPPFVTALAAEDRCHLNGLALVDGHPRYVTALGETDSPQGWRSAKATGGCVIDIRSNVTVARGFAMPHSPRVYRGRLWLLDSGTARLVRLEPESGRVEAVAELPGYTRGLDFAGPFAFVGLSKIRETSTFGDVPITERRDELRCGVGVVELDSGRVVALLEFKAGVEEIFEVRVLPRVRWPAIVGPSPASDDSPSVWIVPERRMGAGLEHGRG